MPSLLDLPATWAASHWIISYVVVDVGIVHRRIIIITSGASQKRL